MQLSICMPSRRDFNASRRAIETALAYCEARDAVLILSDNSGDTRKRTHWRNRWPRLKYVVPEALDGNSNFMNAIRSAETPFVLPMGDDDELLADAGQPAFDLATLAADHVGVRPITQVWTPDTGTGRIKDFAITGDTPAARVLEYNSVAEGDNSAFYSIFRRDIYLNLMELFNRHHPTKGGYCDWSQTTALFAYGKMARDPGTVFRYNFAGWARKADLERKVVQVYADAGLPADAQKYHLLLLYLDTFIFVSSRRAPFAHDDFASAIGVLSGVILNGFLAEVKQHPDRYGEVMQYIAELVSAEQDAMGRFHLSLLMANEVAEGLKDRYIDYYKAALNF